MARTRAYLRFVRVVWQFLPLLISYARDRRRFLLFGGRRRVSPERQRRRARRLLNSFLGLGPTFIKFGQLLSTRPDVLPPTYVEVLSELQDRVPPAPWPEAREVLESEVGPVEEAFDAFDEEPISGASLGQVYEATVDGQRVAVKVRRPGVERLVEADLRVLRWSLPVILWFVDDARAYSLENLADEFAITIREEMDYEREARMLREIGDNFRDDPTVYVPDVVESHSGPRVLTMEFVAGTKISDVETLDELGVDRGALAERLTRAYFQMIVDDGVYHADPHPGNLAVRPDGTLVFYDFGMSGRIDDVLQDRIVEFYVAVANQDTDRILDALIALGTLSPEADRAVMAEVTELAIADARGEAIADRRVQQIVTRIEDTIYEFPMRLPSNLALVLRVGTVVEGVCLTLDPEFDFIAVVSEYLAEEGHLEAGARRFVEDTGEDLVDATRSALRTPPKLERALDRMDRDDFYVRAGVEDPNRTLYRLGRRLSLAALAAGGTVASSVLYAFESTAAAAALAVPTALLLVALYRSFSGRNGVRATPQFGRQGLRDRRQE